MRTAYRLLPTAYCLLLTASCLLLTASCGNNRPPRQSHDRQDLTVFAYLPSEIDTIRVIHSLEPLASFELAHEQDMVWMIKNVDGQTFTNINNNLLRRYLSYYAQVNADNAVTPDNKKFIEIIKQGDWQHSIRISSSHKPGRTVQLYGIPAVDGNGEDTDKCLIYIVENKEIAHASWISFDLLLKKFPDFVE